MNYGRVARQSGYDLRISDSKCAIEMKEPWSTCGSLFQEEDPARPVGQQQDGEGDAAAGDYPRKLDHQCG